MRVTVRRSPLEPPLSEHADANTVELRDAAGRLCMVILFPPGKSSFILSHNQEPGFEAFARELGFAPQGPPA